MEYENNHTVASSSTNTTVTKFLGSFKHLKFHFRRFYKKCTCNANKTHPSACRDEDYTNELHSNDLNKTNTSLNMFSHENSMLASVENLHNYNCRGKKLGKGIPGNGRNTKSIEDLNCKYILPTPPRTPLPLFHPDGDFLLQVIPPPLEFQDKVDIPQTMSTWGRFNNYSGDAVLRTESGTSINVNVCEDNCHLNSFCPYSATPKFAAISPSSQPSILNRPKSRGGFSLNDSLYLRGDYRKIASVNFKRPTNNARRAQEFSRLCVTWKDLPKSISLNINSGFVESMFIPTWSNQPLIKAPFFVPLTKVINWCAIEVRMEKVGLRKQKLQEMRRLRSKERTEIWSFRREIALIKRALRGDKSATNTDIKEDIKSKYQFIHWLCEKSTNVNSIGRYFDVDEKRLVLIKKFSLTSHQGVYDQLQVKVGAFKEIDALKKLSHLNIIDLLTYFEHPEKIHLVLEACDHSLRCEISGSGAGVNPKMVHGVMYQILRGVEQLHSISLLHNNLSPDNILVTVEGIIKISDFSKSIFINEHFKPTLPSSIKYAAPELLALDSSCNLSADIWSVGCILVELLLGKVLWNGSSVEEQILCIHKSIGPLLPQHAQGFSDCISSGPSLREVFPANCQKVVPVIEMCLEVDGSKRATCKDLLQHPFIKRGNQLRQTESLPRMALWEIRPLTAPVDKCYSEALTETPKTTIKLESDETALNPLPTPILRTKTAVKKPRGQVVFSDLETSATPVKNEFAPHRLFPDSNNKNQLYGVGTKHFWKNLNEIAAASKALSGIIQESSPILKKGNEIRKTEARKPLETIVINVDFATPPSCNCTEADDLKNCMPNGPRSRIQYLISALHTASWSTVQVFTDSLLHSAKKNPKTFGNHVGQLTTILLDQISEPKSKVAGPAIRILNNICEHNGSLFEPESERIIESLLNKLGGPSFIEKESNEVLRHLANALKPNRTIISLIKYAINHKVSAARQSAILLIENAMKQIDLISNLGLPGEQTPAQRRFSVSVFEIATKFLRDSNSNTRMAARGVYQLLMHHPGFWYLYQSAVTEEKRHWVNRLLDEIRRFPMLEKRNL